MGARGKASAESQKVAKVTVLEGGFGNRKVEPPDDLTDEEKEVWRQTVATEPKEAFTTAALQSMLKDYCRHRCAAESVSKIINGFKPEWLKNAEGAKRYRELLRIRDMECRGAADKATKLRLTNQSRYTPKTAATAHKHAMKTKMPWDDDYDEAED